MNLSALDIGPLAGVAYLVSATLFYLGLRRLSSPATARSGNLLASVGMLIAVVVTLLDRQVLNYQMIVVGIILGSAIGAFLARRIQLTAMPQLVAAFNGVGGGASAIIAASEFLRLSYKADSLSIATTSTVMLGTLIGLVTFAGSLVAFGKLQGFISPRPVVFPLQKTLSTSLFISVLVIIGYLIIEPGMPLYIALSAVCLALGVLLVVPIGGADMPVVISLLNSYSGLAAASAGFVLGNPILIVAGALVGAAGLILTMIMTRAMNRSLTNVIFGAFGTVDKGQALPGQDSRPVRSVTAEDAAIVLAYARSVIFVPGYGLAVAQAQHQLKDLGELLESKGIEVRYAIHPVAGRMPGHMNVLLAEADIPYDKLYDLDQINDQFDETDVVVVVGANDVVNPAARDKKDSPIFGMPILNVDMAQYVIVLKRSLSPGFAGIDNDLFYNPKTMMLFGDARDSLRSLESEIKIM